MKDVTEAIRRHHRELMEHFGRFLERAVGVGRTEPVTGPGMPQGEAAGVDHGTLKEVAAFLKSELLPHAHGEERYLYPAVDPLLKAYGKPTATMSVDHEAIEQYVRDVDQAVSLLEQAEGEERKALHERLRTALLQLQALLRLHLEKEERVYLPLFEAHLQPGEQRRILEGMHAVERSERRPHPNGGSGHGQDANGPAEPVIDVRPLPPPQRHPLILQTFDELPPGGSLVVINDHDPRPLNYQFHFERPGQFSWEYLEQGPEVWRVRIGKIGNQKQVGAGGWHAGS